jgi:hypothetical protein
MEMAKLTLLQESLNVRANLSEDEVANQTSSSFTSSSSSSYEKQ